MYETSLCSTIVVNIGESLVKHVADFDKMILFCDTLVVKLAVARVFILRVCILFCFIFKNFENIP